MEAVTSSSPPAGAPTFALVVWTRPDVHELPEPSAVMSRLPLPSRWTLLVELVIVSISPVPKFAPGPVSYIHWESMPEPAAPLKSSLNTVDQPDGGAGPAAGAAIAAPAAGARADAGTRADTGAAVAASAAGGAAIVVSAKVQPAATASAASRRARGRDQALTAWKAPRASRSKPVIGHNLRSQEL